MKLVCQYMAISSIFSLTSSHLHPLQVENCDSNSRLVVDGDDNGKFRLKMVRLCFATLTCNFRWVKNTNMLNLRLSFCNYCRFGDIREVLLFTSFARRTNSRILESRESYYYYSATKEKGKLANSKLREKFRAGALGWWSAPLPFTPEFGARFPVSAV